MKKLLLSFAILCASLAAHSQIITEHTYNVPHLQVVVLSGAGEKYAAYNDFALYLYNTDHTLYKNIALPAHAGYTILNISLISDHLFNFDNNIEYYASFNSPTGFKAGIYDESGGTILDLDTSYYATLHHIQSTDKYVMIDGRPNSSVSKVYSLPGSVPCGGCSALGVEKHTTTTGSATMSAPIPNPATGEAIINFTLPYGTIEAAVTLYDVTGRALMEYPVKYPENSVKMNVGNLPPGMYTCTLHGGEFMPVSEKLLK